MDARRPRQRDERGETLVEMLVALTILGLAAVAVLAGVALSAKASDINRKESTGGAYVRSYAAAIERYVGANNYKTCNVATADAYNVAAVTNQLTTLPSGYSVHHTAAVPLSGAGAALACSGSSSDTGIQRLTLTVASADGRAAESLTVVLRRPCDPSGATCTS